MTYYFVVQDGKWGMNDDKKEMHDQILSMHPMLALGTHEHK